MKRTVAFIVFAVLFAVTAYASASISQFNFTTADGKSVEFMAGNGSAMVVKVCSAS